MKKILFIATGGTIASKKTENGLTPQITPEELLSYIPEVEGLCEITAVNPFNLDSSNVVPENWSTLVKVAKEHYEDYDGFVIAHGTDTMAYTAAALSYMIQNSEKPIVITGAQRPINWISRMQRQTCPTAFITPVMMHPRVYRLCSTEKSSRERVRRRCGRRATMPFPASISRTLR